MFGFFKKEEKPQMSGASTKINYFSKKKIIKDLEKKYLENGLIEKLIANKLLSIERLKDYIINHYLDGKNCYAIKLPQIDREGLIKDKFMTDSLKGRLLEGNGRDEEVIYAILQDYFCNIDKSHRKY